MSARGTDKRGQGGASATIVYTLPRGRRGTRVDVVTDFTITGRLARFGRGGMIQDISNRLLRDFAGVPAGDDRRAAAPRPPPRSPAGRRRSTSPAAPPTPPRARPSPSPSRPPRPRRRSARPAAAPQRRAAAPARRGASAATSPAPPGQAGLRPSG